jgi:ATP-dependent helicase YprA (DUF1998 family)
VAGVKTLVFVKARRLTEMVAGAVKERLKARHLSHLASKVDSYRAGGAK